MVHGKRRVLRHQVHRDCGRAVTASEDALMHVNCGTCGQIKVNVKERHIREESREKRGKEGGRLP
jgi:hypothetical protein